MEKILLSIGHGGTDPGAVGTKTEHEVATVLTKELGKQLEAMAEIDVVIVDEKDTNGNFLNTYPDIAIKHSNHLNGSNDKSANGAEVIMDNTSGATKLCSDILKVLENHGLRNRGIKKNEDLYVLNYKEQLDKDFNHILEWGFITNDSDVKKLLDKKENICKDIANLYINYYGWKKKGVTMEKGKYYDKKESLKSKFTQKNEASWYSYKLSEDKQVYLMSGGKSKTTLKKGDWITGYKKTRNGCETVVFDSDGVWKWAKMAEKGVK